MVVTAASSGTLRTWRSHRRWRRAALTVFSLARFVEVLLALLGEGVLPARSVDKPGSASAGAWSAGLARELTSGWPRRWQRDVGWSFRGLLIPGFLWKASSGFVWAPVAPGERGAREFLVAFETIQRIEVADLDGSTGVVLRTREAEVWVFLKDVSAERFMRELHA